MILRTHEAVDRRLARTGMNGGVMLADVSGEQCVELLQRMDRGNIESRQPAAAERPEVPFDLLSEHSDKRSYTTDFFIRIFFEKKPYQGNLL